MVVACNKTSRGRPFAGRPQTERERRVRAVMDAYGLTTQDVADKMRITRQALMRSLRSDKPWGRSLERVRRFLEEYGETVEAADLVG